MPLELKGLKANISRLKGTIDDLNSAASKANDKGDVLKEYLGDIVKQVGEHVDDIEFAASMLGNSSGESEKLTEKPKPAPAVIEADPPQPAPQAAPSPPPIAQRQFDRMG